MLLMKYHRCVNAQNACKISFFRGEKLPCLIPSGFNCVFPCCLSEVTGYSLGFGSMSSAALAAMLLGSTGGRWGLNLQPALLHCSPFSIFSGNLFSTKGSSMGCDPLYHARFSFPTLIFPPFSCCSPQLSSLKEDIHLHLPPWYF